MTTPKVLLSLFDGTGSICVPFRDAGWIVKRLDIDGSHGADIVVNVLEWDPAVDWTGPGPDVIFAGPPCEQYSTARTRAKTKRNLMLADSLVEKTLATIDYFHNLNPKLQFFVENPDSSMLWKRWISHRLYESLDKHPITAMLRVSPTDTVLSDRLKQRLATKAFRISCTDKHTVRLDYCQYGTNYRKRTRLMTNNPFQGFMCDKKCPYFINGRHVEVAQRGPRCKTRRNKSEDPKLYHSLDQLHAYPSELVRAIFLHVTNSPDCHRTGLRPITRCPDWVHVV